jgi:hypothetical protein
MLAVRVIVDGGEMLAVAAVWLMTVLVAAAVGRAGRS